MNTEVPNLDCMDESDLQVFYETHAMPTREVAAILFPSRPRGFIQATRDLGSYAFCKRNAMLDRLGGNIEGAKMYEEICDARYKLLPTFARW